jgi:signal transduction histidine kinase
MRRLDPLIAGFNERTLAAQFACVGIGATGAAALIAWVWVAEPGRFVFAWTAGGLLATCASALLARRTARALRDIAAAAAVLRREELADGRDIPLLEQSAELRQASASLRRLIDAARRQKRALEERNAALSRNLQARTHELSTLQDLSIGLAAKSEIHELVDEALGALEQTMEYASASLWARADRRDGGQVVLLGYRVGESNPVPDAIDLTGMRLSRANLQRYEQIERERAPIIENQARQSLFSWLWSKVTDDARSSELYRASRSWMAAPLKYREDVLGVMRVDHQDPDYFDAERSRLLTAVVSQTALAMRHAQLLAHEREMAVIVERNRIARDLHDAVSQTLFAANVLAGTLAGTVGRDPAPSAAYLKTQLQALERLNRGALSEMRLLMFELRPDALLDVPLAELLRQAIDALTCQGDLTVESSLATDDGLSSAVRIPLYRIAQEAFSNIARHSGADHVVVQWTVHPAGGARLRIADDGKGFDPDAAAPGHFGLENMRSRALEIGALLSITSVAGQGSELLVELNEGHHVH